MPSPPAVGPGGGCHVSDGGGFLDVGRRSPRPPTTAGASSMLLGNRCACAPLKGAWSARVDAGDDHNVASLRRERTGAGALPVLRQRRARPEV